MRTLEEQKQSTLKYCTSQNVWFGTYRGLTWCVHRTDLQRHEQNNEAWCYCITIPVKAIPEEHRDKFVLPPTFDEKGRAHYEYLSADFSNVEWHCGVTYYSPHFNAKGAVELVEIGCDYSHYFDMGQVYSQTDVTLDALATIDELRERYPWLLCRCQWDGAMVPEDQMVGGYCIEHTAEVNANV